MTLAIDVKTYIPEKAKILLPVVKEQQKLYLPGIKIPEYFGGLVEQESCLSLTHSRCWSPKSRLKTSREEGAGVGQITRAFNSNGSVRFDSLTDLSKKYRKDLGEASWDNIYSRPDLQIRIMVIMTRDNLKQLYSVEDDIERFKMADAAYNGGLGGLQKERRYCGLKANCDPDIWFGNVEVNCLKSKKPLYNQTACSINRDHVKNVFTLRMKKYKPYFE